MKIPPFLHRVMLAIAKKHNRPLLQYDINLAKKQAVEMLTSLSANFTLTHARQIP